MPASKFTAARRNAIVEAIARGNTLTHAAALAGVSRAVVYQWLAKGEAATNPRSSYRQFSEDVARANALIAEEMVGVIRDAAPDHWQAAVALLERRFPDQYGKRERHEVAGPDDGPIKIELIWPTGAEPPR